EDRPGRHAVGVGHHLAHASAGIADRAPDASALDDGALVLRIGLVLRALEIIEALPARLRAAECLPIKLDIETFGGEEAVLLGDEVIESHAFGSDGHCARAIGHGDPPRTSCCTHLS